ncbi:M56 family metallopeptidase [Saccharibacillus alkalitolerans]|uniref:M56 family metallopeptidase n=1 Tax=Saccharibacillus alkalitolerans TaxID=2705290 RepID=A0ABX0F1E8_9BACL|nr:M56 family metallopeptidase [Saccharibacillus alkalitolerans]NGZ74796.1 M56 family metallopeptidase [Saccharibacillus alkalitolerans]
MNGMFHVLPELLKTGFREVLLLSAMGSVLAVLILGLRRLLGKRLRPGWLYLLWIPLLLRLIIPWSPESPVNLYGWMPQAWTGIWTGTQTEARQEAGGAVSAALPVEGNPFTAGADGFSPLYGAEQAAPPADGPQEKAAPAASASERNGSTAGFDGWSWAALVWLTGMLALLLAGTVSGIRFGRRVRLAVEDGAQAAQATEAAQAEALLESCRRELGLRRAPRLIVTDLVSVPTVVGPMSPRLLLPTSLLSSLEDKRLRHVLLHELAHIKRRDIAVNVLAFLLTAVHWFNPLLAYAFRKLREDQETACDELALGRLPGSERLEYGLTLIALLERNAVPVKLPAASGLWSGRKERKRRMSMIASYRKNTWKSIMAGTAAVLLLGGCALTGPASRAEEPPSAETAENPAADAANNQAKAPGNTEPAGSENSAAGTIPSTKAKTPPAGEEGTKIAAFGGVSVYVSDRVEDPRKPLLRRFTIRSGDGKAASYLWNYDAGGGNRSVLISESDLNGDGQNEIVLIVPTGNGTELSLQEAHVLKASGLEEIPAEDPVAKLNGMMRSSIVRKDGNAVLNAELNGVHVTKRYEDIGQAGFIFDKAEFGAIVGYTLAGNTLNATLAGRASAAEFPIQVVAKYDRDLSVSDVKLYPDTGLSYDQGMLPEAVGKKLGLGNAAATRDWKVRAENELYWIDVPGGDDNPGQDSAYGVNAVTGTIFDGTSGSPLASLNRQLPNEADFEDLRSSDGSVYQAALDKRVRELADDAGWKLAAGDGWFEGFEGDGSVLCSVEWDGRKTTVKADLFTGFWSETK